jgi:hypothetical protein
MTRITNDGCRTRHYWMGPTPGHRARRVHGAQMTRLGHARQVALMSATKQGMSASDPADQQATAPSPSSSEVMAMLAAARAGQARDGLGLAGPMVPADQAVPVQHGQPARRLEAGVDSSPLTARPRGPPACRTVAGGQPGEAFVIRHSSAPIGDRGSIG